MFSEGVDALGMGRTRREARQGASGRVGGASCWRMRSILCLADVQDSGGRDGRMDVAAGRRDGMVVGGSKSRASEA